VPDVEGLRPSPDRVRETLFNWLFPGVTGERVLDLFAGSGALALEALFRGAASAMMGSSGTGRACAGIPLR
jgi:16S rRNA (guanine966-N2)-methyltransferase